MAEVANLSHDTQLVLHVNGRSVNDMDESVFKTAGFERVENVEDLCSGNPHYLPDQGRISLRCQSRNMRMLHN